MVQYLSHSIIHPCARMIWILTTCLILRRCQSPYHRHQSQICPCAVRTNRVVVIDVSPFLLPSLHQSSTLEKTSSYQHSTLSNLTSKLPKQVSLFFDAAQFASSEEIDFHVWFSPGFLMQQKLAHQESFRCIARPSSSSVSTLL